jgi:hypothetical protein
MATNDVFSAEFVLVLRCPGTGRLRAEKRVQIDDSHFPLKISSIIMREVKRKGSLG